MINTFSKNIVFQITGGETGIHLARARLQLLQEASLLHTQKDKQRPASKEFSFQFTYLRPGRSWKKYEQATVMPATARERSEKTVKEWMGMVLQ